MNKNILITAFLLISLPAYSQDFSLYKSETLTDGADTLPVSHPLSKGI
jgi:hypothetical protein